MQLAVMVLITRKTFALMMDTLAFGLARHGLSGL